MEELAKELKKENYGKVLTDVSLKNYTTYKVGGIARIMVFPTDTEKLVQLIRKLQALDVPYMVLGNGSNVLFSDRPYEGVIIKLDEFNDIRIENNKIVAGAGASLMKVAYQSIRKSLSGLEFATGIPGSVQISEETFRLIAAMNFNVEKRGDIELNGRGKKTTYIVRSVMMSSFFSQSQNDENI